ncbi:MAG: hypothetical protein JSS32_04645 [Verrucomicrobia bacterium]|nr:hypothetical protein [Verrucomicrobiota bacterium]
MRRFILGLLVYGSLWAGANDYFEAFPRLKKSEDWTAIVSLGQEALQENLSPQEAMQIHGQLASTFFYQGNFQETENHAAKCLTFAFEAKDLEQEIHALYLLSAAARGQENFGAAKLFAAQALKKVGAGPLRAKVLFNLGAAEADDPAGDLEKAKVSFQEAIGLYTCPEDQSRTAIRLGKVYLLQGELKKARDLVLETLSNIESERVKSHAEFLLAQIEKAEGHREEALWFARMALSRAEKLSAQKDCERIAAFLESL